MQKVKGVEVGVVIRWVGEQSLLTLRELQSTLPNPNNYLTIVYLQQPQLLPSPYHCFHVQIKKEH